MICERCQKAEATVHVDDVQSFQGLGHGANEVEHQHLCETCASGAELPGHATPQKSADGFWQLLEAKASGEAAAPKPPPTLQCGTCGTTFEEVRRKGRLGCEGCYSIFEEYLAGLLERMHGAVHHEGRLPGLDEAEAERRQAVAAAQEELDRAIAAEEFERAAELRDQLAALAPKTPPG